MKTKTPISPTALKKNLTTLRYLIIIACILTSTTLPSLCKLPETKPNKKLKVFVLAGQSNMEGRADGNKLSVEDLQLISVANKSVRFAYNNNPPGPLGPVTPSPEIADIYKIDLLFGPEIFFGIELAKAWPDKKILLIKLSEGGTSLHGAWHPEWSEEKAGLMGEEKDARLYPQLINYVKQVLAPYNNDTYEICAMLWVQGETDSENTIAASSYGTNLRKLIEHVRTDLSQPSLPFYLFEVGQGKVVDGMKETAEKMEHVTLLPQSPDPESKHFYEKIENGHYNHMGMKKLGREFARTYLEQSGH